MGFGMGLEFRESANMLNAKNDRKVQAGMVFNVVVGEWPVVQRRCCVRQSLCVLSGALPSSRLEARQQKDYSRAVDVLVPHWQLPAGIWGLH